MSNVQHNTGYLADARKRVTARFRGLPRIDGWIKSYMDEIQAAEDAAWDVLFQRMLDNSPTGDLLDKLGELVGQPRNGDSDADYLVYITARIKANRSDGKRETLIAITLLLVGQANPILFRVYAPKAIEIETSDVTVNALVVWRDFLDIAKAGGDNLRFIFSKGPKLETRTFSSVHSSKALVAKQERSSVHSTAIGGLFGGVFG